MLMALMFSMLLQFALQCQLASKKQLLERKNHLIAEMMVNLSLDQVRENHGTFNFSTGTLVYQKDATGLVFEARLKTGEVVRINK